MRYSRCRRRGLEAGTRGWSRSPSASRLMPSRSMTASERVLAGAVNERISSRPAVFEAEAQRRGGRLGRFAVPPGRAAQPPADLDRGDRRGVERDPLHAGQAERLARPEPFERSRAEAVRVELRLHRVGRRVRLRAQHQRVDFSGSPLRHATSPQEPRQNGTPHNGNQRSSSGSIGSSSPICAFSCSSRSVLRSLSPGAGTNGYQEPRL